MATQTEGGPADKSPIEPTTEFDGMDVRKLPDIDRSKWMAISNMIHYEGRKHGYNEGYKDGVASYSGSYRTFFTSGSFILGIILGACIMAPIIVLLSRG